MIERVKGNLQLLASAAPEASQALERDGYCVLRGVFDAAAIAALAEDINSAFAQPSLRAGRDEGEYRHAMLNRSELCQRAIAHPKILETLEPLLGGDCHVIANTAWRNAAAFAGGPWHCDAGPHVPRPEGVPWDERIPYPIFAIGTHIYLADCPRSCGPTSVVPGSHRSGRLPPAERERDPELSYDGRPPEVLEARAGDVAMFVSDAWHRGMPAEPGGTGRFFLQAHYARRDIAQRLRLSAEAHQLSLEAFSRASTERERALIGLHPAHFYDG
jgi:ectoine hydroxylase-related dioxygenase (phytanoyl-CoA dioxygenase family)